MSFGAHSTSGRPNRMYTVALIGPDGAGKTTIARRLEREAAPWIKYVYMGVNPNSSNHLLPMSRLVRAVRARKAARQNPHQAEASHTAPSLQAGIRATARLMNQLSEEGYRQLLAWYHVRKGRLVIFDRHFFADYYSHDITGEHGSRPLARRLHGVFLERLYPKPVLTIFLDASPELLLARKGEGTLESITRMRADYLALAGTLPRFTVVDASRSRDEVVDEVMRRICAVALEIGAPLPFCAGRS